MVTKGTLLGKVRMSNSQNSQNFDSMTIKKWKKFCFMYIYIVTHQNLVHLSFDLLQPNRLLSQEI